MFHDTTQFFLFVLAINKLMMGYLILYLKSKSPNVKGMNFWAYGSIITAIGVGIYSFFPVTHHQNDFLYSLALNLFTYLGDALFLAGFITFNEKKVNYYILFLFPLLAVTNVIIFSLFYKILWLRMGINAFIGFMLYYYSAFELRKTKYIYLKNIFRLSSFIYMFYGSLQFIRAILAFTFKPIIPIDANPISVFLFVVAGIATILLTFNLIIMITSTMNERLKEQIESKNRLYAIISHDLRNPIGNLMNYSSILKSSIENWDKEKVQKWLAQMEKMANSSAFLLDNILEWSKSQLNEIQVKLNQNDIVEIINKHIKTFESTATSKNIKVVFNQNNSIFAYFDAEMISIVIRNLVSNAIKFTPENGLVIISVVEKINQIEVYISDNGIGINEDDISLIFDDNKFHSTLGTAKEKGSGFGLLICKQFIALNNGTLNVKSEKNVGSEFCFILPKIKDENKKNKQ